MGLIQPRSQAEKHPFTLKQLPPPFFLSSWLFTSVFGLHEAVKLHKLEQKKPKIKSASAYFTGRCLVFTVFLNNFTHQIRKVWSALRQ